MCISRSKYVVLLFCQTLLASAAYGQNVASELEDSLSALQNIYGQELDKVNLDIQQEIDGLRGGNYNALTVDYIQGLQTHIKLLEDSRNLPLSKRLEVLEEVSKDIEIKRRFFDYHETDYRNIEVTVRTLDSNNIELDGYIVHCIASGNYIIYKYNDVSLANITRKIETKTLMKPSSPTSISIPPGVYVWWTERNGEFGNPMRFEIGDELDRRLSGPINIFLPVSRSP